VSVPASVEDRLEIDAGNVDSTLTVLEAARKEDAGVVIASSCAVCPTPQSLPLSESNHLRPESPYRLQKTTVDRHAIFYHDRYDLETLALRYFNVYGPR
jgi:UDP-glucose 4-epimerase